MYAIFDTKTIELHQTKVSNIVKFWVTKLTMQVFEADHVTPNVINLQEAE